MDHNESIGQFERLAVMDESLLKKELQEIGKRGGDERSTLKQALAIQLEQSPLLITEMSDRHRCD